MIIGEAGAHEKNNQRRSSRPLPLAMWNVTRIQKSEKNTVLLLDGYLFERERKRLDGVVVERGPPSSSSLECSSAFSLALSTRVKIKRNLRLACRVCKKISPTIRNDDLQTSWKGRRPNATTAGSGDTRAPRNKHENRSQHRASRQ